MWQTVASTQVLLTIGEFILERSLINVRIVAKALFNAQALLAIREFTLERNLINVKNVEKLPVTMQLLMNMSKFILKRSLINVRIVTKTLPSTLVLPSDNSYWRKSHKCKETCKGFNQSSTTSFHHTGHQRACPGGKP